MSGNTAVALQQPAKPMDRFKAEIAQRESMIRALLPSSVSFDKFQATVVAAVGGNPKLLDVDRGSLIKACIQAAELGLSLNPSLGEGDILQVWDNRLKSYTAQFRPRYMGMMKLARQSGEVLKIEAEIVRENDEFLFQKGDNPRLEHRIKLGGRGEMIGAYCIWTLKNGEKQFEVMDRDQVLATKERSSSKTKEGKFVGPWVTDEEEMWRKTVVRRASKYMPRSCENFDKAVTIDNLHEAGHETDIRNGEIIDITATEIPDAPHDSGAAQVESLAARVAKPKAAPPWRPEMLQVPLDEEGLSDWAAWCSEATSVVSDLNDTQKTAWAKAHKGLLEEAELMAPNETSPLIDLLA